MIHLRITPTKYLLKWGKSQKKKVFLFELKLRQVKTPAFESAIIFTCGFSFLLCTELIKADFQNEP